MTLLSRQIRQNTLTRTKETSWGLSLQADLDVGAAGTLTSITAYRKYRNFGIRDGDFIDRVYNIAGGNQLDDYGPQPSKTFTQEVRLSSPGGQKFEYVIGGFYYNAKQQRTFQRDDIVCSATTLPEVTPGLAPCAPGSSTLRFPSAVGTFGSSATTGASGGVLRGRSSSTAGGPFAPSGSTATARTATSWPLRTSPGASFSTSLVSKP